MKKCKQGYYYCYKDKKCKKIPTGYRVGLGGWLRREKDEEKEEETKKNSNGANGNGNGNGDSSGSTDGGGVSEGWSAKYKRSIDCNNPKGFSQRAHCQGRKKVNEAKDHEKDHEVSMAQTQLKKSEENIRKLRKALGTKEKNIPAWVQAKITDTEHNTDAASSYMEQTCPICNEDPCQCLEGTVTEGKRDGKSAKDKDYSLRDWFKGGGWVQAGGKYDGKPCAKQPGQKTKPFCRDADDRASMSKKERNRRAAKKRKEDPNPNRKGKAKMVTDNYSNWRAELEQLDEVAPLVVAAGVGALAATPYLAKKFLKPKVDKALDRGRNELHLKGNPIGAGARGLSNSYEPEGEMIGEEGKKDACYKKVKARYDVWPSAYASGALVKCRKVGAANWGNKTKKESYDYSNWRDDFKPTDYETINIIEAEPLSEKKAGDPCWVGYKQVGMKKKGGKMVPNCVKEEYSNWRDEMNLQEKKAKKDPCEGKPKRWQDSDCDGKWYEKGEDVKEDWQKVNKKDKTDGMSQKAVDAYKRENPGSKLKTAVTEKKPTGKRAKRRKSFCARSNGQRKMHNIDCSKTPDKAICKARKRWNC